MWFLTINSGSSSVKYSLFKFSGTLVLKEKGVIEKIAERGSFYKRDNSIKKVSVSSHMQAITIILRAIRERVKDLSSLAGVGHRVVHGGERFKESVLIDRRVLNHIKNCIHMAPLHNPPAIEAIEACIKLLKNIPQIAVFDTAFHHTIPDYVYSYAIPYEFYRKYKIRKYGFHGTSHHYITQETARILKKPIAKTSIISCHLGNGCSVTAVKCGKSIDTSMGLTPLEGLVMGTRSGDIDPAIIFFLQEKGFKYQELDEILNRQSGLLGLSGLSNDMRIIDKAVSNNSKRACLAYNVFIYRLVKYISAYIGVLGGLDAVVFTGGIGENQKKVREDLRRALKPLLDKFKIKILIVPTDEELMIAREGLIVLKNLKTR